MRKLTLEEWEKKYVPGPVERFDQKCTMFSRPLWDQEIKELARWVTDRTPGKPKPGYTLQDQALRIASRTGTMMQFFEADRPNPSAVAREISAILTPERLAKNMMVSLPPAGEKLETSDRARLTRDLKKAATYFGADIVGVCKLDRRWVYSHSYSISKS